MNKPNPTNKFWSNGWTIAFGTAIFSFVLSVLKDLRYKAPLLTTIKKIFASIYEIFATVLTFKVSIWSILTMISVLIGILYLINKIFYREILEPIKEPGFLAYKQDTLKKWLWTWDYKLNPQSNTYKLNNLRVLCLKDETPLVSNGSHFVCPRCETHYGDRYRRDEFSTFEDSESITVLIEDNIKRRFNNL